MKTIRFLLFLCFVSLLGVSLYADDFSLLMSSKLIVDDTEDYQFLSCDTYILDDELIFDNSNLMRLYQNELYLLNFDFSAFLQDQKITYQDYQAKGYQINVQKPESGNILIRAVSSRADYLLIDIGVVGPVDAQDILHIALLDREGKEVAKAAFGLEILLFDPNASTMTLLENQIFRTPAVVRLEEADNTNNVIQRELSFWGDTITLEANKSYDFYLEVPKYFSAKGKDYSVVADWENPYNFELSYEWNNPLLFRPTSSNKFKARIVTKSPGNAVGSTGNQWFTTDYLQKQLPKPGTRMVQKFDLVAAPTKVEYSQAYLNKYQGKYNLVTARKRPNPKVTKEAQTINAVQNERLKNLNMQNAKVIQPKKMTMYSKAEINPQQKMERAAPNKAQLQTERKTDRIQANPRVKKAEIQKQQYQVVKPQVYQVAPVEEPQSIYHTLMINVCDDLQEMKCSPVRVTFRVLQ